MSRSLLSVLVVEDERACRAQLCHAVSAAPDLQLAGAADDLPRALQLLQQLQPDVLLTDLGLPSGSGLALIHAARRLAPATQVLVLTALGDDRTVLDCLAAGATGYLLKGGSDVDLALQLRQLRDGGSPISPGIARRLLMHLRPLTAAVLVQDEAADEATALSAQEQQVLQFSAKGCSYDEIAQLMGLSRHTVQTYVRRTFRKLAVHNKAEALFEARRLGLLS